LLYQFDKYELSEQDFHLSCDGIRVPVEPKALRVLLLLVSNAGKLLEKRVILEAVWKDTFVEETTLTRAIAVLRRRLSDDPRSPLYIETVPTLGYRFIAQVKVRKLEQNDDLPASSEAGSVPPPEAVDIPAPSSATDNSTLAVGGFRRRTWGFTAVAAVAFAAGLAILGLRQRNQNSELNAKDTIVLTDFSNSSGDPVFDGTLRQGLIVQLEQSPVLRFASDGQIRKTLKLMGLTPETSLTSDVSLEICQRIGGDVVLDGSVTRLGNEYVIGLRARRCQTGDELDAEQTQVKQKEDVLQAVSQLATRFRTRIGESSVSIKDQDTPLAEATTSSLDALKSYSQALRIFNASGSKAAIPLLSHAIELDPEFAMAHAWLGRMYAGLGQEALALQSTQRAYGLRRKSSERERFLIDVSYDLLVTGNVAHARETCEAWEQMYPRDVFVRSFLSGVILPSYGQYEKALNEAEKTVEIDPEFVVGYKNRIMNLIALNRVPEAEVVLRQASERKLFLPSFTTDSYRIAYLKDDEQGMKLALSAAPNNPWITNYQASALLRSGQLRLAKLTFNHAVDLARQTSRHDIEAQLEISQAISEALCGQFGNPKSRVRDALQLDRSRNVVYGAALVAGLTGDAPSTAQHVKYLSEHFPEDTIVQHNFVPTARAALALAQNRPREAVELLQPTRNYELGQPLHSIYIRGQAYLSMKDPTDAVTELRKIVDHPGLVVTDPLYNLSLLQLARSYAMMGDTANARATYELAMKRWKIADPDFQIEAQAKREYSSL
jgi:DNA-binding winged helix-turn-helix (wHTH) protein/tetratricopeptide (TPR) repeat protein